MTTARLITSIKTNFNLIADPSAKSPQANRAIPSTGTALTRFLTCMAPVIGKRFSTLSHKIYIYICTCIYILVLCCPNHFHSQNKEFKRFSLATCCPDCVHHHCLHCLGIVCISFSSVVRRGSSELYSLFCGNYSFLSVLSLFMSGARVCVVAQVP